MVREGKHSGIDDDTRARARKFVEEQTKKPEKEYRSDPFSKMTKAERDARVGYPDDFPPAIVDDATKRIAKNPPAVTAKSDSPKQRVVSKKELEESGLSLRDFLNRERGLTRRGMSKADAAKQLKLGEKPSAKEVADAKKQLGMDSSLNIDPDARDRNMYERGAEEANATGMKKGGSVKGWGIARGARKAKMR
jgi:hypothetical protein